MKKSTLLISCLCLMLGAKAQTFSDDFESYTAGSKLGPQSPNWTTWSNADGGTEDVNVVTTDNHTSGGSKSIYCVSTSTAGGPTDLILPFGGVHNTGQFTFSAWFKVPSGKSAYFNFQATATPGQTWAMDCKMNSNGTFVLENTGTGVNYLNSTYTQGSWFQVTIDANLNTGIWEAFIDGASIGTFANGNSVASIDIYPSDQNASFWVDDVSYTVTPYTLPSVNGSANMINIANGLVGQQRNMSVKVRNLGSSAITSFSLAVSQNGGTPVGQNVTGVNIASLGYYTVNIATPFTLTAGTNTFAAVISNVNGGGADGDATDDMTSTTVSPVQPAAGKMVVAEEGTGTWCGWCPRGAVYMDMMAEKYDGYFAGIAVHNGDVMTHAAYDAAIGFSSFPNALVNRDGNEIDPSGLENPFLSKITVAPKAFILNGATYNSSTRQLNISLKTTIQSAISGDYRIACVLTEDSVTGTGSQYNQSNYYAGGSSGAMGGFESLANPVPAAQMNYNHVARQIFPAFAGQANAYGTSATASQTFTHSLTYVLPAGWDANQIHIVGLFIDPTGKIDNASSTTIAQAVTNGYTPGTDIAGGVGLSELDQLDSPVSLFPNPASDRANITLNLEKESDVNVSIYSANGTLIAKKDYGKLSGGMLLPIDMSNFTSGMYFVNVSIDGKTSALKLIKQ